MNGTKSLGWLTRPRCCTHTYLPNRCLCSSGAATARRPPLFWSPAIVDSPSARGAGHRQQEQKDRRITRPPGASPHTDEGPLTRLRDRGRPRPEGAASNATPRGACGPKGRTHLVQDVLGLPSAMRAPMVVCTPTCMLGYHSFDLLRAAHRRESKRQQCMLLEKSPGDRANDYNEARIRAQGKGERLASPQ